MTHTRMHSLCPRLHTYPHHTEMAKAGLIDEMMNDALDSALDDEGIEEETDAEVEKVS